MKTIDAEQLKGVLEQVKDRLEEYLEALAGCRGCVTAVMDIVDAQPAVDRPPRDPLTLEQLREMDGEPVWVVFPDGREEGCWMLVHAGYELCRRAQGGVAAFENHGKTWAAYRDRPKTPAR